MSKDEDEREEAWRIAKSMGESDRRRKARIRKCSNCGSEGHNIRTCDWPVASPKDSASKKGEFYYKGKLDELGPVVWSRNKALVESYYEHGLDWEIRADCIIDVCVRCVGLPQFWDDDSADGTWTRLAIWNWSSLERYQKLQDKDVLGSWDSVLKFFLLGPYYCEECKDIHDAEETARYEAEAKAAKAFDEYLDERQESFSLDGFTISSSAVIKKMMPAYYEEELTKWKVKNE